MPLHRHFWNAIFACAPKKRENDTKVSVLYPHGNLRKGVGVKGWIFHLTWASVFSSALPIGVKTVPYIQKMVPNWRKLALQM
jgi:hypothetical protein